jgi:hypothetical protein
MKCPNCGANLPEDSQFCYDCGAQIRQPPPARPAPPPIYTSPSPPRYPQPAAPVSQPPPRKRTGLFLAIGAVVLIMLGVFVAGAGGLFYMYMAGSPSAAPTQPPVEAIEAPLETKLPLDTKPAPANTQPPSPTLPAQTATAAVQVELPCSNGALLLEDNFNREPALARPFFDRPFMRYWQNQQSGIIQSDTSPALVLPVIYPNLTVADFNIEFSASPGNMKEEGAYGLLFRSGQANNSLTPYYLMYIMPNRNVVLFTTWIDPDWSEIDSADLLPGVLGMGGGGQVRLEVLKDRFRLFVNNHFVSAFQSTALSKPGLIGLVLIPSVASTARAEEVWFGNLMIYKPGACK